MRRMACSLVITLRRHAPATAPRAVILRLGRACRVCAVWITGSARPGARYGQFWRWILIEVGVAVGQPGSTDSVLCFERVPAWSVVWVLAGDIGECRGWLLCSSSA
jgi:hypothetical protein